MTSREPGTSPPLGLAVSSQSPTQALGSMNPCEHVLPGPHAGRYGAAVLGLRAAPSAPHSLPPSRVWRQPKPGRRTPVCLWAAPSAPRTLRLAACRCMWLYDTRAAWGQHGALGWHHGVARSHWCRGAKARRTTRYAPGMRTAAQVHVGRSRQSSHHVVGEGVTAQLLSRERRG